MSTPVFAVVGRVNRGKSSIVSTLAADDSVAIDAAPGTTRHNREYPLRLGDETLYTLIDTPGFERPRHVLAWLQAHATSTEERRGAVERFVREHAGSGEYAQECELLQPILAGAAILYVVDGSVPFSAAYEAETEILRWTGQPRMALINPIGPGDHAAQWRAVLDQYFSLVRVFDAHGADFEARIELLRALRELADPWRAALDRAIHALELDRAQRVRECAGLVADAIVDLLTLRDELRLAADEDPEPHREGLAERFYARLRERELRLRHDLRRVFFHERLRVVQSDLDRADEDLFATSTWSRLGLSRVQLLASGAASGALIGGGIDLATGLTSVFLGALIGGSLGLVSSLVAWDQLADVRVLGAPLGGRLLCIGPIRSTNFGWIALDRAWIFYDAVSRHAHARRVQVAGDGDAPEPRTDHDDVVPIGGRGRHSRCSVVRVERGVQLAPGALARPGDHLTGLAVTDEHHAADARQLTGLHDAVRRHHRRRGGDVETRFDHAVVAEAEADARVRPEQAAFADRDDVGPAARQRAQDRRAPADVAPVTDDDTGRDATFDHRRPERAGVEVAEALVHDDGALGEVGAEADAGRVGDAHLPAQRVTGRHAANVSQRALITGNQHAAEVDDLGRLHGMLGRQCLELLR